MLSKACLNSGGGFLFVCVWVGGYMWVCVSDRRREGDEFMLFLFNITILRFVEEDGICS